LDRKEGLGELSPKRRLVPAEPVHDLAVEIRQAQKADRDVSRDEFGARGRPPGG